MMLLAQRPGLAYRALPHPRTDRVTFPNGWLWGDILKRTHKSLRASESLKGALFFFLFFKMETF